MIATIAVVAIVGGCTPRPGFVGGVATNQPWGPTSSPPVAAADARMGELSRRVQLLDEDNRQLQTQLAQSEQQMQVFRDESELLRRQLADMSDQVQSSLAAARSATQQFEAARGQVDQYAAAARRGAAGMIAPRSDRMVGIGPPTPVPAGPAPTPVPGGNLAPAMPVGRTPQTMAASAPMSPMDPATPVRRLGLLTQVDGGVIRVVLPSDRLFTPGSMTLHGGAASLLDPVITTLRTHYPRQRIGIEAYTDDGPIGVSGVATSHQLTAGQAAAVLDDLTRRGGMPPGQLFTVAQGVNHPRHSNQTAAGRAANRRIELVIYPTP